MAVRKRYLAMVPNACMEITHFTYYDEIKAAYAIRLHRPMIMMSNGSSFGNRLIRITDDAHLWCREHGIAYELCWRRDLGGLMIDAGNREHQAMWTLAWL